MAASVSKPCPRCGTQVQDFLRIDAGMRLRISEVLPDEKFPDEVCGNCFKDISQNISRGAKLRADHQAKEQNKMIMWRSRVNFVKQGRIYMTRKAYSEAAVAFEKYIRVLEIVFDKKAGELTPETFKDSARTKEITVVASVLWDLVRIYDTSPRYGDRQKKAAQKLATFLQFSPLHGEILRKARQFESSAKNPSAIKEFIKLADKSAGRCFVATACFFNSEAEEVLILRAFRDQYMAKNFFGKGFIFFYETVSPPIATFIREHEIPRRLLRPPLRAFALWLSTKLNLQSTTVI